MNKLKATLFLIFSSTFFLFAQEENEKKTFNVGIQIRPRAEFRNGQGSLIAKGQDPALFITNRSRIKLDYSTKHIELGVAGQSVGVWGQQPQSEVQGGFMLNEAWAKIIANDNLSFILGRQELSYDGDRILGTLDWHSAGRFHDLLLTKFQKNKIKAHVGLAYNANKVSQTNTFYYSTGQPYQHMEFGWFSYQVSDPLKITALFMNTGFQTGTDTVASTWKINNLQTMGANIFYAKAKWKIHGLYYYQTGQNKADQNVSAFMASLSAKYQITKKTNLFAGADYLSGTDMNSTSTTEYAFAPLFGTNHGYYGYMDYFYVDNHVGDVGLIDLYIGATNTFTEKFSMRYAVHAFNSAAQIVDAKSKNISSQLGSEIDISFKYKVMPGVALLGGYSQLFATESMNYVKNISSPQNVQNWAWVMLNIDLTIFNTSFTTKL